MIQTFGRQDAPCVLVVDDELQVLASLGDLLRDEFYVIVTDDPDEAAATLRMGHVALLLTDQRMPRATGAELLAICSRFSPHTTRILITAYSDIEAVIEAVNDGAVWHYVTKPWNGDQLLSLVRGGVEKSCLEQEGLTLIRKLADVPGVAPARDSTKPPAVLDESRGEQNEILRRTVATFSEAVLALESIKAVVPICMYCHHVKTATGQWQEILEYLTNNSQVLSHGICPKCLQSVAGITQTGHGKCDDRSALD